jgi:hypothetical protein
VQREVTREEKKEEEGKLQDMGEPGNGWAYILKSDGLGAV